MPNIFYKNGYVNLRFKGKVFHSELIYNFWFMIILDLYEDLIEETGFKPSRRR